jgi:hypothetical protein
MVREEVERQIRDLLATETQAASLSNKLFTPTGLFSHLANTEEERWAVTRTDLWRDAQARVRELEKVELAAFQEAAKVIEERLPHGRYRIRFEPINDGNTPYAGPPNSK